MSVLLAGAVLTVPVVNAIDVMSVFAPEAAALRFDRAVAAVVPPVPPLAMAIEPEMSALTMLRNVGVPAAPSGAARTVLAVCDAKLEGRTASVPPSVSEPVVVTVPLRFSPLTVPVPETDVTVPVFDVYPAGLLAGYAPKFVSAVAASVAPVPPLATPSVPPRVSVPVDVIGPPVNDRPVVPPLASTLLTVPVPPVEVIVKFGYVPVTVVKPAPVSDTIWSGAVLTTVMEPDDVIGPPETLMPVPAVRLTLVTVPAPEIVSH
jgi:hypothetical protein